jgi:hypothetical protein
MSEGRDLTITIHERNRTEKPFVSNSYTLSTPSASHAPPSHCVGLFDGDGSTVVAARLQKRYERRPRYKTRQDRYEPKVASCPRSSNPHPEKTKKRRPAIRKSSKHTWMSESFKPTNVRQGRLTVSTHGVILLSGQLLIMHAGHSDSWIQILGWVSSGKARPLPQSSYVSVRIRQIPLSAL